MKIVNGILKQLEENTGDLIDIVYDLSVFCDKLEQHTKTGNHNMDSLMEELSGLIKQVEESPIGLLINELEG